MADLLSAGFFPKELPSCFTSVGFANAYPTLNLPSQKDCICESTFVTLPQASGSRRTLTVPNPKGHLWLVKALVDNWADIDAIVRRSQISKSRPTERADGCITLEPADLPAERLRTRKQGRFLLRLDISDFYRSVYTHALPWAIHGRAIAKHNRTAALFGNVLDRAAGLASSNETHGIPVGPVTSLVLAELLLSPIDQFITELRPVGAYRFYDDFELSFETQSDATGSLEKIEAKLSEYRLGVNPLKTRVDQLPAPIERSWLRRVRQFRFNRSRGDISASSLDDFFDNALEISRQEVGDRVLPYAIGRIQKEIGRAAGTWARIETFLLHFLFAAPEVTPNVVSIFVQAQRRGLPIDKVALAGC